MAILKVDTITSADTPTVSITDGASISGVTTFSSDINIADKIVHAGDTNTAIRFSDADTISFETAGSARAFINSAGDLTIGGSAGTLGKLYIKQAADTDSEGVTLLNSGGSNSFKMYLGGASGAQAHLGHGGQKQLNISQAGLVGVGTDTSASSCKLQVVEPDSTECYIQVANQTTGYDGNSGLLVGYNGSEVAKIMNLENTAMDIGTNGNSRISIANDGHIVVSNSIAFDGETGSANRLDDYEEGSFTPSVNYAGGTSGLNVTEGHGKYIKIGHFVHATMMLSWDEGSSSGALTLTGLPFTIKNDSHVRLGGHAIYLDGFSGLSGSNIFLYNTGNSTIAHTYFVSGDNDSHLGPADSAVTHSQTSSGNTTRWVLHYYSA